MGEHTVHHSVLPTRVYLAIGAALLVLTVVTVLAARIDLGSFNIVVAMLIAAVKASLVVLFFMHLKYDHPLYAAVMVLSVAFVAVFIIFTAFDTERRGEVNTETAGTLPARMVTAPSAPADTLSMPAAQAD